MHHSVSIVSLQFVTLSFLDSQFSPELPNSPLIHRSWLTMTSYMTSKRRPNTTMFRNMSVANSPSTYAFKMRPRSSHDLSPHPYHRPAPHVSHSLLKLAIWFITTPSSGRYHDALCSLNRSTSSLYLILYQDFTFSMFSDQTEVPIAASL